MVNLSETHHRPRLPEGPDGFRYRSTHPAALRFPENRENNRELLRSPTISALSARSWRPFALQFRCVAGDSLFCTEQGNCFAETGNSSVGNRELSYLIPNLSSPSNCPLEFLG